MSTPNPPAMRLHTADNVVVARVALERGAPIAEEHLSCRDAVPFGHKIATTPIAEGAPVKKYGQVIGFAARAIEPGEHVHTHNVTLKAFERDYAFGADLQPADGGTPATATFEGIVRSGGRVATRNYIGVLSNANCSATAARQIADAFRGDALEAFPNVDGVVALTHGTGCGMSVGGEGHQLLEKTLAGYARHPNFAGVVMVGLGCEDCQIEPIFENCGLARDTMLRTLTIQEAGGSSATVRRVVGMIREMLPEANRIERQTLPAARLVLGLQCGGSDAYSGITANPALGAAVDRLVRAGGTAVLGETPEVYGAEHLLTRRAVSQEVGEKLLHYIRWWEDYMARNGGEMNNNPSPGNKAGGLTTILEKSLGATAKGGATNLVEVYGFAEPVTAKGFVFMDTPGYDPVSITGIVAGGANMLCFTTGRGSVFGCKPVPVVKLASNTPMYTHIQDDMDVNCGTIADGESTVDEMGERIFHDILQSASGRRTKSETAGVGDHEFVPWQVGAVV